MKDSPASDELALVYDGECPVCTAYSCNVGTAPGTRLRRVDARGNDILVAKATAAGFDLDDGMVVLHRGVLHHGADALHLMAILAPRMGFRNRLNRLLFGSRTVAQVAYPMLRVGRNMLLRLRGSTKIRNLDIDKSSSR